MRGGRGHGHAQLSAGVNGHGIGLGLQGVANAVFPTHSTEDGYDGNGNSAGPSNFAGGAALAPPPPSANGTGAGKTWEEVRSFVCLYGG